MSRLTDDNQTAVADQLDDIGDEFGCQRVADETDELFARRLLDYLEEMITELRNSQNDVRELIA